MRPMPLLAVDSSARCLRAVSAAVAARRCEPSSMVAVAGFVCGGFIAGAAGSTRGEDIDPGLSIRRFVHVRIAQWHPDPFVKSVNA